MDNKAYVPVLTILAPPDTFISTKLETLAEILSEANLRSVTYVSIGGVKVSPKNGKYSGTLVLEEEENVISVAGASGFAMVTWDKPTNGG